MVLDYTWRDIVYDFRRVARECLAARALAEGSARQRSDTPVADWPGHG